MTFVAEWHETNKELPSKSGWYLITHEVDEESHKREVTASFHEKSSGNWYMFGEMSVTPLAWMIFPDAWKKCGGDNERHG